MSDLVEGEVKWFNPAKGYGFVVHEGRDVFLHSKRLKESGISSTLNTMPFNIGDKLKFKIEIGPKGDFATNISKVV